MTRLKTNDICRISSSLEQYNNRLLAVTGRTLLGIACHAASKDETQMRQLARSFLIHVVPVTAGQGIITDFSATVCAILEFIGFKARVADQPDASGIALAFENRTDAIMMADDLRFVGINLKNRVVADNSEATGRVFAAALDLMAKGLDNCEVLVLGCGPVGESAARALLSFGATVALCDTHLPAARSLKEKLSKSIGSAGSDSRVAIEEEGKKVLSHYGYILEATPSLNTIADEMIRDHTVVAAPGVPLGMSENGCRILRDRLVHDKLELGVAAMAVLLLP